MQVKCFSTKCGFNPRKPVLCDTIPGETWENMLTPDRDQMTDTNVGATEVQFGEQTNFIGVTGTRVRVTYGSRKTQRQLHHQKFPPPPPPQDRWRFTISGNLEHTGQPAGSSTIRGVLSWCSVGLSLFLLLCWASFLRGTGADLCLV